MTLTSNPVEKYSQDVTVNGVTTEGGLTLDPTNKDKVQHDLAAYKVRSIPGCLGVIMLLIMFVVIEHRTTLVNSSSPI